MAPSGQLAQTLRIKLPVAEPTGPGSLQASRKTPKLAAPGGSSAGVKLGDSEQTLYRDFMQSIYDAVLVANWDGRIVDGNARALEFLRYSLDELRERTLFDVLYGLDEAILRQICENLVHDQFTLIEEAYCRRKDQSLFPAEIATNRLHLGGEQHICFFVRDITRRKQDETLLRDTRDQLARAERLEMAGRIAGHIAHDFNNLLTPLLAYPDFIREALPPDSPAREDLNVIATTAQQIADINQQLLALSRRAYHEQALLNLNHVVETELARLARSEPGAQVTRRQELAPDLLNMKGSTQQLLRVIQNLCQNALEAMSPAGTLTVRTFNVYLDEPIQKYERMEAGEYVAVSIADTGHGIPTEIRDKIFDPFFTTKKADLKRGSGLGLSVVRGIVKDHNGYLDLESQPGQGTVFTLYFPACREALDQPDEPRQRGGTERILLVDDDRLQIEVMGRLLRKLGYTVESARSGEEALRLMEAGRATHELPDLVVLDMVMGSGMDGAQTFERMKDLHPGQKSIIVSGYSESPRVDLAQSLGAGAYLRKPVTIEKLGRAVREELDRP